MGEVQVYEEVADIEASRWQSGTLGRKQKPIEVD
jgi:hypothetical protein